MAQFSSIGPIASLLFTISPYIAVILAGFLFELISKVTDELLVFSSINVSLTVYPTLVSNSCFKPSISSYPSAPPVQPAFLLFLRGMGVKTYRSWAIFFFFPSLPSFVFSSKPFHPHAFAIIRCVAAIQLASNPCPCVISLM